MKALLCIIGYLVIGILFGIAFGVHQVHKNGDFQPVDRDGKVIVIILCWPLLIPVSVIGFILAITKVIVMKITNKKKVK